MATIGDTLPHCTGTGTQADPYIFENEEGFLEAIDVEGAYVEAGTSNLTFNCNDGVVTPTINFKCLYIDGKGLTIFNALVQNAPTPIIKVSGGTLEWIEDGSDGNEQEIHNINIYNFCIINYDISMTLVTSDYRGSNRFKKCKFVGCNFAGICIGYPPTRNPGEEGQQFLGFYSSYDSHEGFMQYNYINCTFNINLSDNTNMTTRCFELYPDTNDSYYGAGNSYIYFENVTFCMSGSIQYRIDMSDYSIIMNNTTIMSPADSISNKLSCSELICKPLFNNTRSGYNYFKMYLQCNSGGIIDNLTLINTSRVTAGNIYYAGIQMQETDPSLDTYIYSDTNLSAKGFLVGRVIT